MSTNYFEFILNLILIFKSKIKILQKTLFRETATTAEPPEREHGCCGLPRRNFADGQIQPSRTILSGFWAQLSRDFAPRLVLHPLLLRLQDRAPQLFGLQEEELVR